jgi:hypothetical protein
MTGPAVAVIPEPAARIPEPRGADRASVRYRQLDADQIRETLKRVRAKIGDRFPGSGLFGVSEALLVIADETAERIGYLQRPHWPLRIGIGLLIILMLAVLVVIGSTLSLPTRVDDLADVVTGIEAAINDILFLGFALFFLLTIETRLKRRLALNALHQLRSLVHIVDMHQLTKDPERLRVQSAEPAASASRTMDPEELGRYLDYCSELLSLSSKLAALYVQHFNDPVVLGAVNEIESLATGFSGKIWQKITLLQRAPSAGTG